MTAAVVGTKILFCGGRAGTPGLTATLSLVVDVYDTVADTWDVLELSVARAELAASTVGNLVLIGGGVEANAAASAVVDIYDVEAGAFLNATVLTDARWALQAVTVGAEVLFVGGFNGINALATVDIYNSVTLEWTVKELNVPRYNFAVAVDVDGSAYFCGGQTSSLNFLASVEVYSGAVETPTPTPEVTPTPTPEVTPTPTPVVAPTPTPGPGICASECQATFDNAEATFNVATGYTVQCSQWTALFACLTTCADTAALTTSQGTCSQTLDIQRYCDCGAGISFSPAAVISGMATYNAQIVTRFEGLVGVVSTGAGGATTLNVNGDDNTFSISFTWEDTATYAGGEVVTVQSIGDAWAVSLAEYFNTDVTNFAINQGKKRAQQTATLNGEVVDNSGTSGVSQLTISCAFLLVTFLLHVLF